MARLDLSWSDIYNQVSEFLGYGSSPTGTNLTLVKNLTYRAYRQFLLPVSLPTGKIHRWSFLKTTHTLTTRSGAYQYPLPADFAEMLSDPTFSLSEGYGPLRKVSSQIIANRRAGGDTSSYPVEYAIVPSLLDKESGTQWQLWLWPTPSGAYTLTFPYIKNPIKPDTATDYFLGGPQAGEVILEMTLAIAEQQENDTIGIHTQLANDLLQRFILADTVSAPDTVGRLGRKEPQRLYDQTEVLDDEVYIADR